jgi:hypothetical protein
MVANILHGADRLSPQVQELLAELVEELSETLNSGSVPSEELAHLTECATQLVQAAKQPREKKRAVAARDRLENALVKIDAQFPTVAAIGRKLVDTLVDLGI